MGSEKAKFKGDHGEQEVPKHNGHWDPRHRKVEFVCACGTGGRLHSVLLWCSFGCGSCLCWTCCLKFSIYTSRSLPTAQMIAHRLIIAGAGIQAAGFKHINVSELAKTCGLCEGYDDQMDTYIIDEDKVFLKGVLCPNIEFLHLVHGIDGDHLPNFAGLWHAGGVAGWWRVACGVSFVWFFPREVPIVSGPPCLALISSIERAMPLLPSNHTRFDWSCS